MHFKTIAQNFSLWRWGGFLNLSPNLELCKSDGNSVPHLVNLYGAVQVRPRRNKAMKKDRLRRKRAAELW